MKPIQIKCYCGHTTFCDCGPLVSKQTAMQTLIAWGDKMMEEYPLKVISFAEAIDKAEELLQMERVQIIEAYADGSNDRLKNRINQQYYKETYGKENDRS